MQFDVNYPEIGASRDIPMPDGYRHLRREAVIAAPLADAAELLMTWGLHQRCGLHPTPTAPRAAPGVKVTLRFARLLTIPCQVTWADQTPERAGFGYGSLPGHPERGEAAFLLETISEHRTRLILRSFSTPGTTLSRLAPPMTRLLQTRATNRFTTEMKAAFPPK
ncbi:DUF1990 domain-containing protein [Glycomyces paridis]|uniref:DUF1990 domain-containing protein n=1 Tax=Glycomyces paridis TaxID=2126555 RepID=A0A4S8P2R6_9ACTN|nr:DUF1990 domain-containing protein [Glycomyces paridis]THV23591.1 DUF1990 domain-containing protein [Glycomyces paridis]